MRDSLTSRSGQCFGASRKPTSEVGRRFSLLLRRSPGKPISRRFPSSTPNPTQDALGPAADSLARGVGLTRRSQSRRVSAGDQAGDKSFPETTKKPADWRAFFLRCYGLGAQTTAADSTSFSDSSPSCAFFRSAALAATRCRMRFFSQSAKRMRTCRIRGW